MTVRVGINGFGRIGRNFFRAALAGDEGVEVVAVNDPGGDAETMAHLLAFDSVVGPLGQDVKAGEDEISIDGNSVKKLSVMDPTELPWGDLGVQVVIESTGLFTARDKAAGHVDAGASKVIISAPSGDADVMVCMGVNDDAYDPAKHTVISNASCTTNCLAPMARILHDTFGIENGLMTTVHAYTSDQALQDVAQRSRSGKPDLRRMRAAGLSIIPAATGAARAIGKVVPELDGKLDGMALRVPVPVGSITDLVANVSKDASSDDVNAAFREASSSARYQKVLSYTEKPLVSADIVGNPASCVFSGIDTSVNGRLVKVLGWYDNEWGYSTRLVDVTALVGASL